MPKKKEQVKESRTEWAFANIRLSDVQKVRFGDWMQEITIDDVWVNILPDLLIEHKLTLNYVSENDHYTCSLTGKPGTVNDKITLSSFARDIETALQLAVFKFTELAGGDLTPFVGQKRESEDFG